MKYILTYKSKFDGRIRTEIVPSLNDLIARLLKINDLTDCREKVRIKTL